MRYTGHVVRYDPAKGCAVASPTGETFGSIQEAKRWQRLRNTDGKLLSPAGYYFFGVEKSRHSRWAGYVVTICGQVVRTDGTGDTFDTEAEARVWQRQRNSARSSREPTYYDVREVL